MQLGTYAELKLATKALTASIDFFAMLGFRKLGDDVITDGSINIRLAEERFASPTLSYAGSDMSAILSLTNPRKQKGQPDTMTHGEFTSPNNLRVTITSEKSKVRMPVGTPTKRKPISKLGEFGEFTIPVKDVAKAVLFWAKVGFEPLHIAKIPYPYAILSDGLIVVGLHQTYDIPNPTITYFAQDMGKRINEVEQNGISIQSLSGNADTIENATFTSPDGQRFFLFKGDPFK